MTKNRKLLNAKHDYSTLSQNEKYNFSLRYALSIYPLNAIYTFIPKNACSSLRFSVAVSNGFIEDLKDFHWIHQNNETFNPTQREIARASYTFVVLRCPFTRVVSCFFDQIVGGDFDFTDSSGNKLSISFKDFIKIIKSQNRVDRNEHWRNQSDFLHYEEYDEYFSLELFNDAVNKLEKKGIKVFDTRVEMNHSLQGFKKNNGNFTNTKEIEIKKMKEHGNIPSYKSMFDKETIELVNEIYSDDIALYKKYFRKDFLLF